MNHRSISKKNSNERPGEFRISGGIWKNRVLLLPAGLDTRPLTARIRDSLLNMLGDDFSGFRIAETCAGSGSFGFECASRNADEVIGIEPQRKAFTCLQENWKRCDNPTNMRFINAGFEQGLPQLENIDLIFSDPPFPWFRENPNKISAVLELSAHSLRKDGLLIIRGEKGTNLTPLPESLNEEERRVYGRSWIAFLRKTS